MKTWYTQPPTNKADNKFASFYLYDEKQGKLVRIRLELGRTSGSGDTKAMYMENRSVRFSLKGNISDPNGFNNSDPFKPIEGYWDYDWDNNDFHSGNVVTNNPYLPKTITNDILIKIASWLMSDPSRESKCWFTDSNATEEELTKALNTVYKKTL